MRGREAGLIYGVLNRGNGRMRLFHRPADCIGRVNRGLEPDLLGQLRVCVQRGHPWGDHKWVQSTAERLNLGHTPRGPGRPKKE